MDQQKALYEYLLRLADNNLILGHRVSEWCGHGPILEEDIALTNTALDLIGQARLLLSYAAEVQGEGKTEDDLAYLRDSWDYRNLQMLEQPNGDYAYTMTRQFLYAVFTYYLLKEMLNSKDEQLAAYAGKAVKEATYHLRHSADWVVRLGDGTEESHQRMQMALNELWQYTGEYFVQDDVQRMMEEAGIAPKLDEIKSAWDAKVNEVLAEATLKRPEDGWMADGGRDGIHTEHLGFILTEMQYLQRAYPGCEW